MKTITRTIGEGTFWTSLSNITLKIVWLVTTFFVLRQLSVYSYGLATLVLSIVPILGIFMAPGLDKVLVADIGREKAKGNLIEAKKLFVNYFILEVILGVILWLVVFFSADIIASFYEGKIDTLVRIIAFSFLIMPFKQSFSLIFSINFRFGTQAIYTIIEEVIKLAIILFVFINLKLGVVGLIFAHTFAPLLALVIMTPVFLNSSKELRSVKIKKRTRSSPWSLLGLHGKWSVFSTYLNQFDSKARLWIAQIILGTEAVGLYAIARGLFGHVTSLVPLNKVIGPVIPQLVDQKDRFLRVVNKAIKYQFLVFMVVGVIGFFAIPPIIVLLFPDYESSMTLFRIMIIALIPSSLGQVFAPIFNAYKAQKRLFFANSVKIVAMFVFAPLAMIFFGLIGLAIEFIVSVTLFMIVRYYLLVRLVPGFRLIPRSFVEIDKDDKIIINKIASKFKPKKRTR